MKVLQHPIWQFIGVAATFLAVFVAVILFLLDRAVKDLQIEVLSNSPLISVEGDIAKDIKILYKDQPVQALSVIILRIENTGNIPIKESDYSRPVIISVSPDAEVGEFTVVETRPEAIDLSLRKIAPHRVELSKSLLNPGDQVLVRILALDNDGTLDVNARIADISQIRILSTLEEQRSSGQQGQWINLDRLPLVLGAVLLVVGPILFWNSRAGIRLRQKYTGLEPAPHCYGLAQEAIMEGNVGSVQKAMRYLEQAFEWDEAYVKKAQNDPLFANLREYGRFKVLIEKYDLPQAENHEAKDETGREFSAD
jgi:hypothetical protein